MQDRVVGGGTPFFTDENPLYRGYAAESFLALNGGYLRLSITVPMDTIERSLPAFERALRAARA